MSHAFYRTAQGEENAAYPVPETLKGKNATCLLSDRSRALAQAYVLKRQDGILFDIKNPFFLW